MFALCVETNLRIELIIYLIGVHCRKRYIHVNVYIQFDNMFQS